MSRCLILVAVTLLSACIRPEVEQRGLASGREPVPLFGRGDDRQLCLVSTEYGLISNAPKYLKGLQPPAGCSRIRNPESLLFAEGDWNLFSEIDDCRVTRAFRIVGPGGEQPNAGRFVCADANQFVSVRCVPPAGESTSHIVLRAESANAFSRDSSCL